MGQKDAAQAAGTAHRARMSEERDLGTHHGAARGHVKEMRQKAFIRLSFEKDKRGLLVRPACAFVNGIVKNRCRFAAPPSYNLYICRLSDGVAVALPAPKSGKNMPFESPNKLKNDIILLKNKRN